MPLFGRYLFCGDGQIKFLLKVRLLRSSFSSKQIGLFFLCTTAAAAPQDFQQQSIKMQCVCGLKSSQQRRLVKQSALKKVERCFATTAPPPIFTRVILAKKISSRETPFLLRANDKYYCNLPCQKSCLRKCLRIICFSRDLITKRSSYSLSCSHPG